MNSRVRATYVDGMTKWLLVPKLKPVRDDEFNLDHYFKTQPPPILSLNELMSTCALMHMRERERESWVNNEKDSLD